MSLILSDLPPLRRGRAYSPSPSPSPSPLRSRSPSPQRPLLPGLSDPSPKPTVAYYEWAGDQLETGVGFPSIPTTVVKTSDNAYELPGFLAWSTQNMPSEDYTPSEAFYAGAYLTYVLHASKRLPFVKYWFNVDFDHQTVQALSDFTAPNGSYTMIVPALTDKYIAFVVAAPGKGVTILDPAGIIPAQVYEHLSDKTVKSVRLCEAQPGGPANPNLLALAMLTDTLIHTRGSHLQRLSDKFCDESAPELAFEALVLGTFVPQAEDAGMHKFLNSFVGRQYPLSFP